MMWFSSKVRIVCLIEDIGAVAFMDSVHIFMASEYPDAQETALRLGRTHESEYLNGDGKRVRWRLTELISLDALADNLDGAEVYSEPVDVPSGIVIPFDSVFAPEKSEPTQTV